MSSTPPSPSTTLESDDYDSSDEIPRILSPMQCGEDSSFALPKISACRFCEDPTDTNIRTADRRVYGCHYQSFKKLTGGLSVLCDTPLRETGDYCQVPFDADVAELMVQFVHMGRPPPDVSELGFDVIRRFAEAVEIYQVYPAMAFCRFYMETQAQKYPVPVLTYALKYDHRKMALRFLEPNITKTVCLKEMRVALSDRNDIFGVLMMYHDALIAEAREIFINLPSDRHPLSEPRCTLWGTFYILLLQEHFGEEFSLANFDATTDRRIHLIQECRYCMGRVKQWRDLAREKVKQRKGFWKLLDEANGGFKEEHDEEETF